MIDLHRWGCLELDFMLLLTTYLIFLCNYRSHFLYFLNIFSACMNSHTLFCETMNGSIKTSVVRMWLSRHFYRKSTVQWLFWCRMSSCVHGNTHTQTFTYISLSPLSPPTHRNGLHRTKSALNIPWNLNKKTLLKLIQTSSLPAVWKYCKTEGDIENML